MDNCSLISSSLPQTNSAGKLVTIDQEKAEVPNSFFTCLQWQPLFPQFSSGWREGWALGKQRVFTLKKYKSGLLNSEGHNSRNRKKRRQWLLLSWLEWLPKSHTWGSEYFPWLQHSSATETGRFSSLLPAKSGILDFAPGYSNKMPNLLFQYNSLYPWISWEASARETHQPYDWKTQYFMFSCTGKKQSWILFSSPGIASPILNVAVHNFWAHHLMDDVLGEKWTWKLCTELWHFSSHVISQTLPHLKILCINFSAESFQRIQLSEATTGTAE